MPPPDSIDNTLHVLVTGVNSGLGFGICCRLVDEFLETHPAPQRLNLIITTRDQRKSDDAIRRITAHMQKTLRRNRNCADQDNRVNIQPEFLDLTNLVSCQKLAIKLVAAGRNIDVLILNAGMGGFIGLDWWALIKQSLTDLGGVFTWPTYKLGAVGWVVKPQLLGKKEGQEEPPLAEVFCANVFGHYLLSHDLMPLLDGSRIIWTSSLEAFEKSFDPDDMQGMKTNCSYESSKRLTDILALTHNVPAASSYVSKYTSTSNTIHSPTNTTKTAIEAPRIYLSHPGICISNIMYSHPLMAYLLFFIFTFIRLFGSIWQTTTPYHGATAAVWLALSPQPVLDRMEAAEGAGKWGSATDAWGNERVERTEVEGYGIGGVVGDVEKGGKRRGRWKGARVLTEEGRREFDELGARCWRQMEALRAEWMERLEGEA